MNYVQSREYFVFQNVHIIGIGSGSTIIPAVKRIGNDTDKYIVD